MATVNKKFVARHGLDNNGNSIDNLGVSGASLTRAGAHSLTLTTTGSTDVTFPTTGTLTTGTGTANKVAFWTGTNTVSSDSDLHWDSTNNRLGIEVASPTYKLDISADVGGQLQLREQNGTHFLRFDINDSNDTSITCSSSYIYFDKPLNAVTVPKVTTASTGTLTINVSTTDFAVRTALDATTTIETTGTPQNGQKLIVRLKDNGTSRSLSWNAVFVSGGPALPTVTTAGKWMHFGFLYNTTNSKWMLVASTVEP